MGNKHVTLVHDVELLSVSTATVRGEPRVILTLRLDPVGDFEPINFALSAPQGHRLLEDLKDAIRNSKLLGRPAPEDDESRAAFEAVMFNRPPAKGDEHRNL